ncbi:MAG TPA: hypothetical protein VME66_04410 [Candidatus Acidoferrales bacterium]|nr:hypothetical protein [Candidatus Acidoferrales bacterium]
MKNFLRYVAALATATALGVLPVGVLAANVDLPAGTIISGHVEEDISSKTAEDGEGFRVETDSGSIIYGHLSQVARANIGRKAHLKLDFDSIRFYDGTKAPIHATVVSVTKKAQTNYVRAAGTVLGGMIAGNILGKAVGTNAGGAIGLVGGGLLAANTASDIDIPAGSPIQIQLTEPLITRRQAE